MDQAQAIEQTEETQVQRQENIEQRISLSDEEFQQQFTEGAHAEWVEGEAIVFMPPTTRHQRIVHYLMLLLGTFLQAFRIGEVLAAPFSMRIFPHGSIREPDILFVMNEHRHQIDERQLNGPADLIIEVISPESVSRDRGEKFYEYQTGGVREYWIIDPRPGLTRADFWVLDADGRYRPVPIEPDGTYHSTVLSNFKLDVNSLLADELPDPLKALANMIGIEAILRAMGQQD